MLFAASQLAGNKKTRIIEPCLAAWVLEHWQNGTLDDFPSLPVKSKARAGKAA
jgi:hypothetical protein